MLKKSLCALVLASASLFSTKVEDCKPPKRPLAPHEIMIKQISTVEQAENYLVNYLHYSYDINNYGQPDYIASFKVINERKTDDCDGGALAAAALLSDDGYAPLILFMNFEKRPGHAIFIYKKDGLIGCLGISKRDCILPRFHNLAEVTRHFGFNEYGLINLNKIASDWKDCDYNLGSEIYPHLRLKKINDD